MVEEANKLTPVECHKGLYIKRDDLFRPFDSTINGGKLRQCYLLIESIKDKYDGVISCCSVHSPQAPITAIVAEHFGLPCIIYYGGTNKENLLKYDMPKQVLKHKAKIEIISKSGIHKILYNKARKIADEKNYFVVEYGFNIIDYADILFQAVANQVENIPDDLEHLVITCGSGITSIGVLLGLKKFNKNVKTIELVCTAPSRKDLIENAMKKYGVNYKINYNDLFHRKGFKYENGIKAVFDGIEFHPNYEAKTMSWLKYESGIDYKKEKTLLWVVGAYPKIK